MTMEDACWLSGCGRAASAKQRPGSIIGLRTSHRARNVEKWPEFKRRYIEELEQYKSEVDEIEKMARGSVVTFVYAAHDTEHNSAVVLKEFVSRRKK